ncbi:hypothetical protein [Hyphobacterium sp.]|uniref:hypothetical protein n=1 Tax=Hyphobacterium sp. TaxID=2004662 RepID=UPI003748C132
MTYENPIRILLSTTILIIIASIVLFYISDTASLASIGTYLGGISTSIAIIWLVFNAFTQKESTEIQQKELTLQAEALRQTAQATELDAFLRLHDHALIALEHDARYLYKKFESSESEKSMETDQSGHYLQLISASKPFSEWLKININQERTPSVLSACENFLDKYEHLMSHIERLVLNKQIYELLLLTSPTTQANRVISRAMKGQDSSEFR